MPFHVWITPEGHRALFGIRKWNLDEQDLLRRFVEPYRRGQPITSDGETTQMNELRWMRIGRSADVVDVSAFRGREWELFDSLEQVTDEYLQGESGYLVQATPAPLPGHPIDEVLRICRSFARAANELRARSRGRNPLLMDDEYDVQYVLKALLVMSFDDVRGEDWVPSYAGRNSRVDFLLHAEEVVVEAKRSRGGMTTGDVGDELVIDIARYGQHPRCRTLVCFVYDPEHRLANPAALEGDLSGDREGLAVHVLVEPRF